MPLTDGQKLKVIQLRAQGYGYKKIANELGATRDQVRGYLNTHAAHELAGEKRLTIEGVKKVYKKPLKEYTCKHCNNKYFKKDSDIGSTVFCSSTCKIETSEERKQEAIERKTKTCARCGERFISHNGMQKYCSNKCKTVTLTCEVCGNEFKKPYQKAGSQQKTCSMKCKGALSKTTHGEYYKAFSDIHRGMIVPTSMYKGSDYDMTTWCVVCQKETTRKAGQFLDKSRTRGCEHCRKTLSVGEDKIERWLIDNGIKYKKEYTFEDLTHEQLLRFDFGILNDEEELVMLIEYDGIQHFKPRKQFGGIPFLLEQQRNDKMKNEYVKENGIELIRISYKQKKQIDEMLGKAVEGYAAIL